MTYSNLTSSEGELWAAILNAFDDSYALDEHKRLSRAKMLEVIWDTAAGSEVADRLAQSEAEMLAGIVSEVTGSPVSHLTHSWGQMLAAWFNGISDDPDMSTLNSSSGALLAAIINAGAGAVNDPLIQFSGTIAEDAGVGDDVGTATISGVYTGTPAFALDDDAGGKYTIVEASGLVEVADTLSAGTDSITISVTGITPATDPRAFNITVTAVSGSAGEPFGMLLTLTKAA